MPLKPVGNPCLWQFTATAPKGQARPATHQPSIPARCRCSRAYRTRSTRKHSTPTARPTLPMLAASLARVSCRGVSPACPITMAMVRPHSESSPTALTTTRPLPSVTCQRPGFRVWGFRVWVPPSRGEQAVLSCARPWLARPPARSRGVSASRTQHPRHPVPDTGKRHGAGCAQPLQSCSCTGPLQSSGPGSQPSVESAGPAGFRPHARDTA